MSTSRPQAPRSSDVSQSSLQPSANAFLARSSKLSSEKLTRFPRADFVLQYVQWFKQPLLIARICNYDSLLLHKNCTVRKFCLKKN